MIDTQMRLGLDGCNLATIKGALEAAAASGGRTRASIASTRASFCIYAPRSKSLPASVRRTGGGDKSHRGTNCWLRTHGVCCIRVALAFSIHQTHHLLPWSRLLGGLVCCCCVGDAACFGMPPACPGVVPSVPAGAATARGVYPRQKSRPFRRGWPCSISAS